jgi:hypothetical protein
MKRIAILEGIDNILKKKRKTHSFLYFLSIFLQKLKSTLNLWVVGHPQIQRVLNSFLDLSFRKIRSHAGLLVIWVQFQLWHVLSPNQG